VAGSEDADAGAAAAVGSGKSTTGGPIYSTLLPT